MKKIWLLFFLFPLLCANEVGFDEAFNLAEDREKVLKTLIPGTSEYYYYHCLHYQHLEKYDVVSKMLQEWVYKIGNTTQLNEIKNRQALLEYRKNPKKSLQYIIKQLGLTFHHQKIRQQQKKQYAATLNESLISDGALKKRALRNYTNLAGFRNKALPLLINDNLSPDRRRELLKRLVRPDYPRLPMLVVEDLRHRYSRGFGSLKIHKQLLLGQLRECLKRMPKLVNNSNFVQIYLSKLRPGADSNWLQNRKQRHDYLQRSWRFVKSLNATHNSLKAHFLYYLLVWNMEQGNYPENLFFEYIKLPKSAIYSNSNYLRKSRNHANLNANYQRYTQLSNIANDESLVRKYLGKFFITADGYEKLTPYINDNYLKSLFAETKIVYQIGEQQRWYSMLSPKQNQELRDRVDLEFLPTNQQFFNSDDKINLDVALKNVSSLIIKTYHIHAENYYHTNGKEITTAIDLDGLIANHEEVIAYNEISQKRHHHKFSFPHIDKMGVYIVEFIGNGKSNRALIRKGQLVCTERIDASGHVFNIYNANNKLLKNAYILLKNRKYTTDKDGDITIPFSNRPGQQKVILCHENFANLHTFKHRGENYRLQSGIYIDRESLLYKQKCRIIIRPSLLLNGIDTSIELLEKIELTITSTDRDGITATKKVRDLKFIDGKDTSYEFKVPENLVNVSLVLNAKVQNLSSAKEVSLSVSKVIGLNGIDATVGIDNLYLRHVANGYELEFLGKNGEPRGNRVISLSLEPSNYTFKVNTTLQTDENGRISLGKLQSIGSIHATVSSLTRNWSLTKDRRSYPRIIQTNVKSDINIAIMEKVNKIIESCSLLELRHGAYVTSARNYIKAKKGFLIIKNLPAGDYDLWLKKSDAHIIIRVAAGEKNDDYVLGKTRYLERKNPDPLQVQKLSVKQKKLTIKLDNVTPDTRVHVIATHFMSGSDIYQQIGFNHDVDPAIFQRKYPVSQYLSGRKIGDEYRYILERKYAKKFPGNMLTRPSLLLNPWNLRNTDTRQQHAKVGDSWGAGAPSMEPSRGYYDLNKPSASHYQGKQNNYANFNFLANTALILNNLKPDANGIVSIPLTSLHPRQHIHVIAINGSDTVYRQIALPRDKNEYKDLRLLNAINKNKHFSEQKNSTVVRQGRLFNIADIATTKMEVYDSLQSVYDFFGAMNNSHLKKFHFITRWSQFKMEKKKELYSKYGCHELNFFIYKKDRSFFNEIIHPYLENKKDKTFIDHWLLGDDLSSYLRAWNYQRLNIVERILLSQKIEDIDGKIKQQVKDLYNVQPENIDLWNRLFQMAIRSNSLDSKDKLGLEKAQDKLPVSDEMFSEDEDEDDDEEYVESAGEFERKKNRFGRSNKKYKKALSRKRKARTKRREVRQFYRSADKTKEWVENNYYQLPIEQQIAALVKINRFWYDYANQDEKNEFLSANFTYATKNFTEMMFALSVLDLPFTADEPNIQYTKQKMAFSSGSNVIIFHQEIKEAEGKNDHSILINESFFAHDNRYFYKNNERFDKFIKKEFQKGKVYGCQVVLTNPTSSRRKINVLLQIPRGAMPVLKGFSTKNIYKQLQPYSTTKLEYYFYFPRTGKYSHYPVHVAQNGKLIAFVAPFTFNVVSKLSEQDKNSWQYISQNGSENAVISYLSKNNLFRIKLDLIAFRMKNASFFNRTMTILKQRHTYNQTLWSYGLLHNHSVIISDYLSHTTYAQRCGKSIASELLTIDPILRQTYQHKEYWPLIHQRTYRLGKKQSILNQQFFKQYQQFQECMRYRNKMNSDELVTTVIYLLLQDRVEQAIEVMKRIDSSKQHTRIQYDYLQAYMAFYLEQPQKAKDIAVKYKDYPVERWRLLFTDVTAQVDEIFGKETQVVDKDNRTQQQTKLANSEPSFDFGIEKRQIQLQYQNLSNCSIRYYPMDIELLFSRNPFVQRVSGQFSIIQPNMVQKLSLKKENKKIIIDIPKKYRDTNVMIEIAGAGKTKTNAYYPHSLDLQILENYGQLKVAHLETSKVLSKVYVKVYARYNDGRVLFYKDGYTDLRGRFDYASLNTDDLDRVSKFSILIMSEKFGAIVREVKSPKM